MYSFLKPVHKEQDYTVPFHNQNGETGAIKASIDRRENVLSSNQSILYANASSRTTNTVEQECNHDVINSGTVDGFISHNGDRRKRRKISVEPDDYPQIQPNVRDEGRGVAQEDAGEPTEAVKEDDTLYTMRSNPGVSDFSKRPRGRPSKFTILKQQALFPTGNTVQVGNGEDDAKGPGLISPNRTRGSRRYGNEASPAAKPPSTSPKVANDKTCQPSKQKSPKAMQGGKKMTLKNGRFAKSLIVVLKYSQGSSDPSSIGSRVLSILSRPSHAHTSGNISKTTATLSMKQGSDSKTTHPFFIGKSNQQPSHLAPDTQEAREVKKHVAWKDIVFTTSRLPTTKDVALDKAPWPRINNQHIRGHEAITSTKISNQRDREKKKDKTTPIDISDSESIMRTFRLRLISGDTSGDKILLPQRLYSSRKDALAKLVAVDDRISSFPTIEAARHQALTACSAFDRAEAFGPMSWAQYYSPSTWSEVLQPSCSILYDWLKDLAVHTIKQGLDVSQRRPAKRRKRVKRKDDDLLDFIISDDDQQADAKRVKNAILIVGPNGCGKTAAVYAVAKQLGFEVFEIHSGMRRSQKDILDKVGDMAQNHMVQRSQALSRDSSALHEVELSPEKDDILQSSVASMFTQTVKKKPLDTLKPIGHLSSKQEQKQSLILFEEVDHLYEDDRGFWSGVQGLIENSKRPVVLTCNALDNVPLDELDLHQILTFTATPAAAVVPYLSLVAAAEGHLLAPEAIETLYRTKKNDLRATMTNLDFWCQMTVGSEKGGLDWYPSPSERLDLKAANDNLRTYSAHTFQHGLDMYPMSFTDFESQLQYAEDCFDLPPEDFVQRLRSSSDYSNGEQNMEDLDQFLFCSDGDLLPADAKRLLHSQLRTIEAGSSQVVSRDQMLLVLHDRPEPIAKLVTYDCLLPLAVERPIFPPSQGRLAPSLELPRSTIATDIAPYVRCIASFDHRLEQMRDELFSSQGTKRRKTRAARAAVEGGDKASTRRERWFAQDLDLQAVLATGNQWPQWHDGQIPPEEPTSSPCESADGSTGSQDLKSLSA